MRFALLLALLAAGGLVAYLLLSPDMSSDGVLEDDVSIDGEDDLSNPALHGRSDERVSRLPMDSPDKQPSTDQPNVKSETEDHSIKGRVVDAETGNPIAGAVVWGELAKSPCPRLPDGGYTELKTGKLSSQAQRAPLHASQRMGRNRYRHDWPSALDRQTECDKQGEFEMPRIRAHGERFDLFAMHKDYICGCVCAIDGSGPVTIALTRGLTVSGVVRNTSTRPIQGAIIKIGPAEGTTRELGHFGHVSSTKEGRYAIGGLRTAPLNVTVDHPTHMPKTLGPMTPSGDTTLDIMLTPAMLFRLNVRSGDGRELEDILVQWAMTRDASQTAAVILGMDEEATVTMHKADKPTDIRMDHVLTKPFRVPVGYGNLVVRVSAKGYAEWRSEPIRVPNRGGEETINVALNRDEGKGMARFAFFKEDGTQIPYTSLGAKLNIGRTDEGAAQEEGSAMTARYARELTLVGMSEGDYRLIVLSPEYAPAEVDFRGSSAAGDPPLRVTLTPAAKIKVTFPATEPTTVTFQLTIDGAVAKGVPIGAREVADEEAGTGRTMTVFGAGSALFGGLAPGRYTIEVMNPELRATPKTVDLNAGETTEIEIPVTRR